MIVLHAPADAGPEISFQGERYAVGADGTVAVPTTAVHILRSHGFVPQGEWEAAQARTPREVESDDELVTETDLDPVDVMSKAELITYLRAKGIGISKGMSVGGLRAIVRESLAEDEKVRAAAAAASTTETAG